jgi:hypothetical protein
MDARSLDVLAHDLSAHDMRSDDVLDTLNVHTIIQGCSTSGARERGKPTPERRWLCDEDLSHQDVGTLRTPSKTALPLELGVLLRTVRFERGLEYVAQRRRAVAVATLRASADQDLEAAHHWLLSVTSERRPVNRRARACHGPRIGRRSGL